MFKIIILLFCLLIIGCKGSAVIEEVYGCMDESACNYDMDATMEDGSCLFTTCDDGMCVHSLDDCIEEIYGCMDQIDFNQSSRVSYYVFPYVKSDGKNLESNDWVIAFNGDVCVGARQWDTSNCNNEICDVPAMGDDSFTPSLTQGYCEYGDVPTFKIYDASENKIFETHVKNSSDMFIDVNAWQNNDIFIVTDTLIAILETGMDCSD